jgi:CheY-like chemotaxis protein
MNTTTPAAKILVVEDEPGVLDLVSRQLRSLGYEVTAVASADDALHQLSLKEGFDLLLTDVVMPGGVNGAELARRARRAFGSELRILMTSGYPQAVFDEVGRPDDDIALLRKPYHAAELADAVSAALNAPAVAVLT